MSTSTNDADPCNQWPELGELAVKIEAELQRMQKPTTADDVITLPLLTELVNGDQGSSAEDDSATLPFLADLLNTDASLWEPSANDLLMSNVFELEPAIKGAVDPLLDL